MIRAVAVGGFVDHTLGASAAVKGPIAVPVLQAIAARVSALAGRGHASNSDAIESRSAATATTAAVCPQGETLFTETSVTARQLTVTIAASPFHALEVIRTDRARAASSGHDVFAVWNPVFILTGQLPNSAQTIEGSVAMEVRDVHLICSSDDIEKQSVWGSVIAIAIGIRHKSQDVEGARLAILLIRNAWRATRHVLALCLHKAGHQVFQRNRWASAYVRWPGIDTRAAIAVGGPTVPVTRVHINNLATRGEEKTHTHQDTVHNSPRVLKREQLTYSQQAMWVAYSEVPAVAMLHNRSLCGLSIFSRPLDQHK